MIVIPSNRDSRPIGVLLGGTGRARMSALHPQVVPALFKSWSSALGQPAMAWVSSVARG